MVKLSLGFSLIFLFVGCTCEQPSPEYIYPEKHKFVIMPYIEIVEVVGYMSDKNTSVCMPVETVDNIRKFGKSTRGSISSYERQIAKYEEDNSTGEER